MEWFALEMNRDHSVVFETASESCISDSFVDHDGYSISSEGFLPTVVDIKYFILYLYLHIVYIVYYMHIIYVSYISYIIILCVYIIQYFVTC